MKIIAISDAHLGQTGKDNTGYFSLLSAKCTDPRAKEKREKLVQEVKNFAGDDYLTLVGVGDILDLSFSYIKDALEDLVELIRILPVDDFVYVVGNHDHFMWTMDCEHRNVVSKLMMGNYPIPGTVYKSTEGHFSALLENFLVRQLGWTTTVILSYPVFYHPGSNVAFTHGHLFGDMYTYMSEILEPFMETEGAPYREVAATVNMPLIEFIYWLLGETGEGMGAEGVMEAVYAKIKEGKKSDLFKAIDRGVDVLFPDGLVKGIPDSWERKFVKWICHKIVDHYVKEPKPLSSLDRHMPSEGSRKKAEEWMKRTKDTTPTLVVGHTHVADDYIMSPDLRVINLGAWLVEPDMPDPDTSVLFIDEHGMELKKI